MTLTAVIIDDARLARKDLRTMLSEHPEIQILGEADGVEQAATLVNKLRPDVIFLDIRMQDGTGFDLVGKIPSTSHVVFTTAYDEHALRAFEVNAFDYLLKPINRDRLKKTIDRLAAQAKEATPPAESRRENFLFITTQGEARFLKIDTIKYIKADGDYSTIVTEGQKELSVLRSLREWTLRLPEESFVRVHRGTIVNLNQVEKVERWFNYSYRLFLRGCASPIIMSQRYARQLKHKLG